MKKIITKRLQYKKTTITVLNNNQLHKIVGGSGPTEALPTSSSVRCQSSEICSSISLN